VRSKILKDTGLKSDVISINKKLLREDGNPGLGPFGPVRGIMEKSASVKLEIMIPTSRPSPLGKAESLKEGGKKWGQAFHCYVRKHLERSGEKATPIQRLKG